LEQSQVKGILVQDYNKGAINRLLLKMNMSLYPVLGPDEHLQILWAKLCKRMTSLLT